jgi:hypothetical protein
MPVLFATAAIVLPLCGFCQEAQDLAVPVSGDAYADTDPSALTDFRGALDGHGAWVDDTTYGTAWVPDASEVGADFTPYVTAGRWAYDEDYVWVSDYEWGWVAFHYGRWVLVAGRGWEWIPGRAYAGAWVDWRVVDGEGYVGWAAMGPAFGWRDGGAFALGFAAPAPYVFCASGSLFAPSVGAHVVGGDAAAPIASRSRPYVPATPQVNGDDHVPARPVVRGPPPAAIGVDVSRAAPLAPRDRARLARAATYARPSTAVVVGARPATMHVVRPPPRAMPPRPVRTLPAPRPHGRR